MSFVGRLAAAARALRAPPRGGRRPFSQRGFDASTHSRLTASWGAGSGSINADLYYGLATLRARSRDLWANNEYAKRWISGLKNDVAGPNGFGLQMRIPRRLGSPEQDGLANAIIEREWSAWRERGSFDVSGKLSGADAERLFIQSVALGGECLVRKRRDASGPFGFAVKFYDSDRLDHLKNDPRGADSGNRVVMGVELDDDDRAVAYHMLERHPQGFMHEPSRAQGHERIPAEEMIHAFVLERPEQIRGIPWMHAGILGLKDMGGFREAAIVAARVGAAKLGFVRTPEGDGAPYDSIGADGQRYMGAEPGSFTNIGSEDEIVSWDPDYPHPMYESFHRTQLQGISGAFEGSTYHHLASDLTGVNFTSGRLGNQSAQDSIKGIQRWMIGAFHASIFPDWLRWSLTTGRLGPLTLDQFDRYNRPEWQPRRWGHIQPREEATANAMLWGLRVKSLRQIAAEMGTDLEETHRQIARETAELERLGISPTIPSSLSPDVDPAEPGEE